MPKNCWQRAVVNVVFIIAACGPALGQPRNSVSISAVNASQAQSEHFPLPRRAKPSQTPVLTVGSTLLIPSVGMPLLKITPEGVTLFHYDHNVLTREYGPNRFGTYKYDRHGRFTSLDYSDGTTVAPIYGNFGELVALRSCTGAVVAFQYPSDRLGLIPIDVSPTSRKAIAFHTALAALFASPTEQMIGKELGRFGNDGSDGGENCGIDTECDLQADDRNEPGPVWPGELPFPEEAGPDGEPIGTITVEGTRDDNEPYQDPIYRNGRPNDPGPIGGGGGSAPKRPPHPHPWDKNKPPAAPGYPPDTFTEDYPPFDVPPPACKDWCMRSDEVAHAMCNLYKLGSRRALCHEQINHFTSKCLRSCDTGDWRWLRGN